MKKAGGFGSAMKAAVTSLARKARNEKKRNASNSDHASAKGKVVRAFRVPAEVREGAMSRASKDGFSHASDCMQVLFVAFTRGDLSIPRSLLLVDPKRNMRGTGGMPTWTAKLEATVYAEFKSLCDKKGVAAADCARALFAAYATGKVELRAKDAAP